MLESPHEHHYRWSVAKHEVRQIVGVTVAEPQGVEERTDDGGAQPTSDPRPPTPGLHLIHLWAIVPLAIAWFLQSIDFIEPFDFWWNVKSGEIMAQTGRFLSTDVLVWTP